MFLKPLLAALLLAAPGSAGELAGSLGGAPFQPLAIKLMDGGAMKQGAAAYDTWRLVFRTEDDIFAPRSVTVKVLVPKGKRLDGRTFRKLPDTPTDKQPSVAEGLPEVQGWSLEDKPAGLNLSHVFTANADLKLEFGTRQGKRFPGKISLVVPASAEAKASSLVGDFVAEVE
jgi:hypothetical protein